MTDNTSSATTCERILVAAEAEFFSKGFAGARTTSIAEAAGVTHAMLHYYYRTKQNLFQTVIGGKMQLLRDLMLSSIGDPSIPLFEKISRCIEYHIDFIMANPQLPGLMVNVVLRDEQMSGMAFDSIASRVDEVITSLQLQIDEMALRGECRSVDARMLLIEILTLDVMPFIMDKAVDIIMGGIFATHREKFASLLKKENIDTILRKLRP